jgi:hypothetical protein
LADEELKAIHWTGDNLLRRRKGDPQKVRTAARLRRGTTMTLEWIAARLRMGAATHVAALLQRLERKSQNSEKTLFRPRSGYGLPKPLSGRAAPSPAFAPQLFPTSRALKNA